MQANSEISGLHLINDRLNCRGLLLLSTIFVACRAYYKDRHLSLSVWRKITVNVFIQRLQTFFYFCHVLKRFFNVFLLWGERSFIYAFPCPRAHK